MPFISTGNMAASGADLVIMERIMGLGGDVISLVMALKCQTPEEKYHESGFENKRFWG
jgi:hypothetical protein